MVEASNDRLAAKQDLQSYMETAAVKFREFSKAMLDVEYNSRGEWQSNLELFSTPRFTQMKQLNREMKAISNRVGSLDTEVAGFDRSLLVA